MRQPGTTYDGVAAAPEWVGRIVPRETLRGEAGRALADQAIGLIETSARYEGYIAKQQAEVHRAAKAGSTRIPADFDPDTVHALSFEVRQMLASRRPATIGEAARLPGVTAAAVSLLLVHLKKQRSVEAVAAGTAPLDAAA